MRMYQDVRGSSENSDHFLLSFGIFENYLRPEDGNYGKDIPLPSRIFPNRWFPIGTNLDGSLPFGDDRPVATPRTRRCTPRLVALPCPLGASPGRFTSLRAPRQPSGGDRPVAAFPSPDVPRGRHSAFSVHSPNLITGMELRFGKDNKSLHPTGSSVTAGAVPSSFSAPAAPAAPAGELNR